MKISWDGTLVDTVEKMVYPYAQAPEKMSPENADTVKWVIEKNIQNIEGAIARHEELLSLKERKMVRIEGGIKTIAPPNQYQREMMERQLKRWRKQLENVKSIKSAQ